MRRSQAPSQQKPAAASIAPPPAAAPIKPAPSKPARPPSTDSGSAGASFIILWAKAGGKKHKSWDDGALLVKETLTCSILNGEGKEIGKSRISPKELEGLAPGKKISLSQYEIEIVSIGTAVAAPTPMEITPSASKPAASTPSIPAPAANTTKFFSVFWCAASTKKHKAMDTGFLNIAPPDGLCTLRDSTGKEVSKTKTKKALEDPSSVTRVGMYEVQIEKEIQQSEMIFNTASAAEPEAPPLLPPVVKAAPAPFKPHAPLNSKRKACALFPPDDPNAFVLYRPDVLDSDSVAVVLDPILKRKLHPHQLEGVKFLYECVMGQRNSSVNGCILADEMGLGKTLQAIALLWTLLKQGFARTHALSLMRLVGNWVKEIRKWVSDVKPLYATIATDRKSTSVATGSIKDCIARFGHSPISPVLIVSYEQFRMYCDEITPLHCDLMICDEGHRIKNASSQVATALNNMNTQRRIILSGTPLQNDLDEFYCMFDFCTPGLLGNVQSFKLKATGEAKFAALAERTGPFMLRRTSALMEHYMPPKQELVLFCKLMAQQQRIYEHLLKKCGSWLFSGADNGAALQFVTYLKKLSNHPRLLLGSEDTSDLPNDLKEAIAAAPLNVALSGKMKVVSDLLRAIRPTSDRVVLVSNYTQTLDLLGEFCTAESYPFLRIDGSTEAKKRTAIVDQFNSPHKDTFVLLLSARAGGVGLNLIGANRLLLFDPDWNPAVDRQAMARVWREGQRKPVFIYRLLSTGTIDEKIYQRQMSKEALGNAILRDEDGAEEARAFSREELRDIFSLNTATVSDTHDLLQCQCLGSTGKKTTTSRAALSKRAAREIGRMTHYSGIQEVNDPVLRQLGAGAGITLTMCRTARQGSDGEEEEANESEAAETEAAEGAGQEVGNEREAAEEEPVGASSANGKRRRVVDDYENFA